MDLLISIIIILQDLTGMAGQVNFIGLAALERGRRELLLTH